MALLDSLISCFEQFPTTLAELDVLFARGNELLQTNMLADRMGWRVGSGSGGVRSRLPELVHREVPASGGPKRNRREETSKRNGSERTKTKGPFC